MSQDKKKVLIIDNQYYQYSSLSKCFEKANYEVYPTDELYEEFMDNVRIFIDPRYDYISGYRDKSKQYIINVINNIETTPDIIIIDYILGGSHKCETGIDLANKIVKDKPVLFISIENKANNAIIEGLKGVNLTYDWAEKGQYQGKEENISDNYYNEIIIKKSKDLLYSFAKLNPLKEKLNTVLCRAIGEKDQYKKGLDNIKQAVENNRILPNQIERLWTILSKVISDNLTTFIPDDWNEICQINEDNK